VDAGRRLLMAGAGGVVCVVGFVLAAAGVPAGLLVLVAGLVVVAPTLRHARRDEPMTPEPDTSWVPDGDDD
jgi:hypothetical protein